MHGEDCIFPVQRSGQMRFQATWQLRESERLGPIMDVPLRPEHGTCCLVVAFLAIILPSVQPFCVPSPAVQRTHGTADCRTAVKIWMGVGMVRNRRAKELDIAFARLNVHRGWSQRHVWSPASLWPGISVLRDSRDVDGGTSLRAGRRAGSTGGGKERSEDDENSADEGHSSEEKWQAELDARSPRSPRSVGSPRWRSPRSIGGKARASRIPRIRDPWENKVVERQPVLLPRTWSEAMGQAMDAVEHAMDQGLSRLRVDLNLASLDLQVQPYAQTALPELMNLVVERLVARGQRVCLLFNTMRDASEARVALAKADFLHIETGNTPPPPTDQRPHPPGGVPPPAEGPAVPASPAAAAAAAAGRGRVGISVLGLGDFGSEYDVAVLVCASNDGNENLQRIECVERLLYAGPPKTMTKKEDKQRFMQRPILLINPSLEAIHSMASSTRKVKPMFMSDFEMVYFLQPLECTSSSAYRHLSPSFPSPPSPQTLDAALFKTAPGTWQVWVREYPSTTTLSAPMYGDSDNFDSTLCSIETNWNGQHAVFSLIWEKESFPSDVDLNMLTDMTNIDWSGTYLTS